MKEYKHLNKEQRYTIDSMLKQGIKNCTIARTIGVDVSTIYRELNRNGNKRSYNAKYAQMVADERKRETHVKKRFTSAMKRYITEKLEKYQWSPEQIVGRAKTEGIEMVSHERIYQYIWEDKAQGGTLYKYLRTGSKKYRKR